VRSGQECVFRGDGSNAFGIENWGKGGLKWLSGVRRFLLTVGGKCCLRQECIFCDWKLKVLSG